jgi:hypothetical protein
MHTSRLTKLLYATAILLLISRAALGQASRVPPRYIDEWYDQRFFAVVTAGALLGALSVLLWLPRLFPLPHSNDLRRARTHAILALLASLLIIAGILLIDVNLLTQFGRQTYGFKSLLSDVFLSRQTFKMLGAAAITFALVLTLWTRFLSDKFYRYMIIPK